MLKLVLTGIWVALVTAAAAYFSAGFMAQTPGDAAANKDTPELEQVQTEMTSVPMLRGGEVLGYVILQLNYAVDKAKLEELHVEPAPYLTDAAFRAVFQSPEADFTRLRSSDIDALTTAIKAEANKRLGGEVVHEVLLQQLNFVRRDDVRTHWIKEK